MINHDEFVPLEHTSRNAQMLQSKLLNPKYAEYIQNRLKSMADNSKFFGKKCSLTLYSVYIKTCLYAGIYKIKKDRKQYKLYANICGVMSFNNY